MYAAQLIDAVKDACGLKTYREVADALGVHETAVSAWRKGKGSPMPEERVIELCAMAKIADPAPWLAGVHADGVHNKAAKKMWESLLDRVRPSIATTAAMLGVALVGYYALSSQTNEMLAFFPVISSPMHIMSSVRRGWRRVLFARASVFPWRLPVADNTWLPAPHRKRPHESRLEYE